MSIFEIIMLVCFGSAWPFSIYKSYRSGTNKGKSLFFLIVILVGYVSGVLHKLLYNFDLVIWLYALNGLLVSVDLLLYWRNSKRGSPAK
jgi:lipopolysaccharide export LptBFGC system permease protein LptF